MQSGGTGIQDRATAEGIWMVILEQLREHRVQEQEWNAQLYH